MQYVRLQKRAIQDLYNGRGDAKPNLSKIVYYGFVQNLIFNALQAAMGSLIGGDDDDDKDDHDTNDDDDSSEDDWAKYDEDWDEDEWDED